MYILATILIVLAAILMVLVVLVQNSKGGGLVSGFSSSNQIMGVRKTTDFLEKATWTLAIAIVFLSIVATGYVEIESMQVGSEVTEGASAAQQQEASKTKIPNFNENAKPQAQPQQQPAQPAQPAK
jgi:preprotein translocase subunit SecG